MFTEAEMKKTWYMGCGLSIKGTEEEKIQRLSELEATGKYICEPKLDGIWIVVFGLGDHNKYFSRTGKEKHFDMPPIPKGMVLVGEAAFGSEYATALRKKVGHDFMWCFDLLRDPHRKWIIDWPMSRRVELMWCGIGEHLPRWYRVVVRQTSGFEPAYQAEHEGIVLKECAGKAYLCGQKVKHWIKCKKHPTFDVIITDVIMSEAETKVTEGMAATIQVGQYDSKGQMVDCGKVTIGKHEFCLAMGADPNAFIGHVCEIRAYKQFKSGKFRHPSFVRMRDDKDKWECTFGT